MAHQSIGIWLAESIARWLNHQSMKADWINPFISSGWHDSRESGWMGLGENPIRSERKNPIFTVLDTTRLSTSPSLSFLSRPPQPHYLVEPLFFLTLWLMRGSPALLSYERVLNLFMQGHPYYSFSPSFWMSEWRHDTTPAPAIEWIHSNDSTPAKRLLNEPGTRPQSL